MATIANLNVKLNLDDSGFSRGLQNTRDKLDSWGSSLRSAGTKMTAAVTTPIVGAGLVLTKWASDLEQTHGATEQLWGENADAIFTWAEGADRAMGMTENSALQNANRFNAMFKQMDAGNDTIMDMSKEFTQLSADLSAMWGGSPDEAADRLTSALRGNYEGLDQYNINLTEAMVNTEAMKIAVADGRDEISEADKVQARYNLIMEQSGDAQGQFARETDTTAGKMAIATARAKNAATAFGKLLLPYVNKLLDGFSTMVGWLEKLDDKQRAWVIGIAAAAAAIGPLLLVIGMLLPGLSALLAVIGFLISPIGLVVIAVAALVAGLVWAYFEFETFRNIVNTVASTIRDVAIAAFEALLRALEPLGAFIGTIIDVFHSLGSAIADVFQGDWSGAWENLKSAASSAVDAIWQYFKLVPSMILSALNIDLGSLLAKGAEWVQGIWDGAVSIWTSVTAWFGGLAADALTWIGETSSTLSQKGTDIIQGFFTAVTVGWTTVSTWFTDMKNKALTAVGDTLATLKQKGTDIISGFYEAVTTRWVAVRQWFINLPTMIFNAIGSLARTLWDRGTEALTGFYSSVIDKWSIGGVRTWFTTLGSKVVSAVGSLASSLVGAGRAVMQGLWDGMKAKWDEVKAWLSSLNPADWKGPERRDKKMLYKPGIWIMQGLQHGLSEGWDDVTRQLSGYTPTISGGLSAGSAGIGGAPIVQIITLEPGKWQEFLADAQQGGKFARNFGSELGMMEGVG